MRATSSMTILATAALAFLLAACGNSTTAAPEQASLAFFKAYQADDDEQLKLLSSRELKAGTQMFCGGSVSACLFQEFKLPDGFALAGDPVPEVIAQTERNAEVELRLVLRQDATEQEQTRCQHYQMVREQEAWHVNKPQPLSMCAAEAEATAIMVRVAETATVQAFAARSTARAVSEAATVQAVSAAATATEQAKPTPLPEAFLTARQAYLRSGVRAMAQRWSEDAALIEVSFDHNWENVDPAATALDGTSRTWSFQFASRVLQKTITYAAQDGVIVSDSGNSAAEYKEIFAGKGEPFDIDFTRYLDSDQAATIGRENKAVAENTDNFRMYLTVHPDNEVLAGPPAYWSIKIRALFGWSAIRLNGQDGEIEQNNFGPTGNPGALPTPMAPAAQAALPTPTVALAENTVQTTYTTAASSAAPLLPTAFGPSGPQRPLGISASSESDAATDASGAMVRFQPINVSDGRPETAWRVTGDGRDQSLLLEFVKPIQLSAVQILPGYAKIDPADGTNRFAQNRRVSRVRLEFSDGTKQEAALADEARLQTIAVVPIITSFVRVVILETLAPAALDGRDFTAVSEVVLLGAACTSEADACGLRPSERQGILAAMEHFIETETAIDRASVGIAIYGIVDGYAGVEMSTFDDSADQMTAYLKQEDETWMLLPETKMLMPDQLRELGIPEQLW